MGKTIKCPYCDSRFQRADLIKHLDSKHEELLPEGMPSAQVVYDLVNGTKGHGKCRVCKGPTDWNMSAGRYDILCHNPRCKEKMREDYKRNMLRVHGTFNILTSDEQQRKMLANRSISGKYKFTDGGVVTYTGSYERKFLEFADKVMQIPSKDIMVPGPTLEYEMNGEKHFYITDFLYVPYNLIIEVKDGGKNPNNKSSVGMQSSRERTIQKEKLITEQGIYHYLRLTDNQFMQLLEIFMDIKKNLIEGVDDKVIRINEAVDIVLEEADQSVKYFDVSSNKSKVEAYLKDTKSKYATQLQYYDGELIIDTSTDKCIGTVFIDNGTGSAGQDGKGEITGLWVNSSYRKHGYGSKLLDDAVNKYHGNHLDVEKSNTVAKNMYLKYGFKTVGDSEYDKNYERMDLQSVKESVSLLEKYIGNEDDIYYNKDKFDSGEINLCFITGLSGSGKSTMGRTLQNSDDRVEHYELDDVVTNWNFSDSNLKEYGDLIYSFFKGIGKKYRYASFDEWKEDPAWDNKDEYTTGYEVCCIRDFIKYSEQYSKSHKRTKFVLEGIWIYKFIKPQEIDKYAVYIKGTSALKSTIRAAKRDSGDANNKLGRAKAFTKHMVDRLIIDTNNLTALNEKELQKFRDYFGNLTKSVQEAKHIANDINDMVGKSPKKLLTNIDQIIERAGAYHVELMGITHKHFKQYLNGKPWGVDEYYSNIPDAISRCIEDNKPLVRRYSSLCFFVFTSGRDLKPIYLGNISVVNKEFPYAYEWLQKQKVNEDDVKYLMTYPLEV